MAERVAGAVAGTPNGDAGKPLPGDLAAMATEARLRVVASRTEAALAELSTVPASDLEGTTYS